MIAFLVTQGDLIAKLRESRALSQRMLGILSKISPITISRAESDHSELQGTTAVRILKAMNTNAQFSTEELGQIQESFGISAGVFIKSAPHPAPQASTDHTPAALTAALTGLVGSQRATEILRNALAIEAKKYKPVHAVGFTSDPERGTDGKLYQVSTVTPVSKPEKAKTTVKKRKSS